MWAASWRGCGCRTPHGRAMLPLLSAEPVCSEATVNRKLSAVAAFYEFHQRYDVEIQTLELWGKSRIIASRTAGPAASPGRRGHILSSRRSRRAMHDYPKDCPACVSSFHATLCSGSSRWTGCSLLRSRAARRPRRPGCRRQDTPGSGRRTHRDAGVSKHSQYAGHDRAPGKEGPLPSSCRRTYCMMQPWR